MGTKGHATLISHLLARSGGCCVKCGRRVDERSVRLVEVPPSRYGPPTPLRILARTEPRCSRCASRYRLG